MTLTRTRDWSVIVASVTFTLVLLATLLPLGAGAESPACAEATAAETLAVSQRDAAQVAVADALALRRSTRGAERVLAVAAHAEARQAEADALAAFRTARDTRETVCAAAAVSAITAEDVRSIAAEVAHDVVMEDVPPLIDAAIAALPSMTTTEPAAAAPPSTTTTEPARPCFEPSAELTNQHIYITWDEACDAELVTMEAVAFFGSAPPHSQSVGSSKGNMYVRKTLVPSHNITVCAGDVCATWQYGGAAGTLRVT